MLLLVGGVFYWVQDTEIADEVLGEPTQGTAERSVMRLDELLNEQVRRNLLGRDVALWDVRVQSVPGDYLFWIGEDTAASAAVVLLGERTERQRETTTEIRAGDVVAIFGTIRSAAELRRLDEVWELPRQDWVRLGARQVYISALRVETLNR